MFNYLIRRIIQMAILLLFSSGASYALLTLAPGGIVDLTYSRDYLGEDLARTRSYLELDLFLPYRFSRWLIGQPRGPLTLGGKTYLADFVVGCREPLEQQVRQTNGEFMIRVGGCHPGQSVTLEDLESRWNTSSGVLFGDFGRSWQITRDQRVSTLVLSRLPRTLELMVLATLISVFIGVPLGVYSAVKQFSIFDYTVTSLAFFGSSMPMFFFGVLMVLVFSVTFKTLGWVYLPLGNALAVKNYSIPLIGGVDAGSLQDGLLHLTMPVTVLVMFGVSGWSRFVRISMLEVLRQDYVRTARAKGLIERVVIVRHGMRNALIPFIAFAFFSMASAFSGAIITETVFNWPGIGRLYIEALGRTDYPVAIALLLMTILLTVIATLASDILNAVADTRLRRSSRLSPSPSSGVAGWPWYRSLT